MISDRQVAARFDEEMAIGGAVGLAEQHVVDIGPDLAAGIGDAGDKDLAALDLDRFDSNLRSGGFRRIGSLRCRHRDRLRPGGCGPGQLDGRGLRHGDQPAGLARLFDHHQHLSLRTLRDRHDGGLGRQLDGILCRGGAEHQLVFAGLQRFVDNDGEVSLGAGHRFTDDALAGRELDLGTRCGLARDHDRTVGLDADEVERRRAHLLCRGRGRSGRDGSRSVEVPRLQPQGRRGHLRHGRSAQRCRQIRIKDIRHVGRCRSRGAAAHENHENFERSERHAVLPNSGRGSPGTRSSRASKHRTDVFVIPRSAE